MTTSATVQMFLFIHLGVILVVTAYYTASAALAPGLAERSRARFALNPWKTMILGLVVSVPWIALSLVMLNGASGGVKFFGSVLMGLWVFVGLIGGAGVAQHVGRSDNTSNTNWSQTARGGLLITLTWVLPLVGWLGVLPLTLATGIGCVTRDLFSSKTKPQPIDSDAPAEPAAE
jgi:hypothetical protein